MNETIPAASIKDTVLAVLSDVLGEPVKALLAEPLLGVHVWDSLASLEALVQLEQQFDVVLDLRSYHAAREVDDLVELVRATRGNQSVNVRP